MGREIKRVALDFDWPLRKRWDGFMNPYYTQTDCQECGGTGYGPEARRLEEQWYDFDNSGYGARRFVGWCYHLEQADVDALLAEGRLSDFTRQGIERPTAEQVNEWAKHGMGHDALNRWICIKARCERLGYALHCSRCDGEAVIWPCKAAKWLAETWKDIDPPAGEGWQLWETVSEGSPISPVFPSGDALADWLIEQGYSPEAAHAFVEDGWSPSFAMVNGELYKDIESAVIPRRTA